MELSILLLQFSEQSGELVIHGMAGLVGDEVATDGATYKRHVTEDVEKLVASGLILPLKRTELEETEMRRIAMLYSECVGQLIEIGLRHAAVVDDKRIREVASADESHLKKRGYLANEDKGASCGEVRGKTTEVFEMRGLRGDEFAVVEVNGCVDREACGRGAGNGIEERGRLDTEPASGLFVAVLDGMLYGKIVTGLVLFKKANAMDLLHVEPAAAIEDGEFGAVDLDQAVVYSTSEEGGHSVFDGADAHVVIFRKSNYCAT